MSDTNVASQFWAWLVGAFFTGATALAAIYKIFIEKGKPKAEIHLSNAQTEKTLVEAHKIVLDDAINALAGAKLTIQELRAELDVKEAENELLHEQNEHMIHVLRINKIDYNGNKGNGKV